MSAFSQLLLSYAPSLYWELNAANGITDSSGAGNTGTAAGGATIGGSVETMPIRGETSSTSLDGVDDRVTSTWNPFTNGTTLTFLVWAWRGTSSSQDTLFASSASTGQVLLNFGSGNQNVVFNPQSGVATATTWASAWPGNNQWHFLVCVFREAADTVSLYQDGALVSTQAQTGQYKASPGNLILGAQNLAAGPYDGRLSHAAVVVGELSATQILTLWNYAQNDRRLIRIRENPPLRQHILAKTPNGNTYRWGEDEPKPENCFTDLSYSTVIPGGYESFDCKLPRRTGLSYQDLTRLSTLTVMGAGARIAAEYRLEKTPRVSGDEKTISPEAVGWQAHLADDNTAAEVYVDRDLSHWTGMSRPRRIERYATGGLEVIEDPIVDSDVSSAGIPGLELIFQGTGGAIDCLAEGWYDAGASCTIASIYYDMVSKFTLATYEAYVGTSSDNIRTASSLSADLISGVDSTATGTQTSTAYRFATVIFAAIGITPTEADHICTWRRLTLWGNHGLSKQGTAPNDGLYASDVITNAVSRWAPLLRYTTGADGTIKPTSFIIPQLEFRVQTTAAEILNQANRFHLGDWAVWEGTRPAQPTFYYNDRNARGRKWRARSGQSKLSETGPQVDRLWNGVVVSFQDVDGTSKTVGPTGALCDATDATLLDTDPLNPVNQLGIKRYAVLDMGIVSTTAAATEVGRQFLVRAKDLDQSGSAEIVGYCTDDKGVNHPASAVRAGDQISFVDASDPSYRRIVHTAYEHSSRTNSIDLDSPPEGMDALLEQLGVSLFTGSPPPIAVAQDHHPGRR